MTTSDRIRLRKVSNSVKLIQEHLEAMQRDAHGIEYEPWKLEVDTMWKTTFESINLMEQEPQLRALESIKELWTMYITHYDVIGRG